MNKVLSKDRLKRVKWASDDSLCQVKLFLSEDCPSQIGNDAEDHLQIKASLHSNGMNVDDLPPGFGGGFGGKGQSYTQNQVCVPQIRWSRPPVFKLDADWHVVAGEESEERGAQNYREMRVLEALYPRASAIPPSPSISPELKACRYDDSQTPTIPLNSIEDEDPLPVESTPCSNSFSGAVSNVPIESKTPANDKLHTIIPGLDADVIAAASAAYAASLKNNNEVGNMVDTELLIRILNEPKMIEALTKGSPPLSFPDQQHVPVVNSQPFHASMTSRPNTESCTTSSFDRANENIKPFPTFSTPYSDASSNSPSSLQAMLSKLGDNLKPGHENGAHPGKPSENELNLPRNTMPFLNSAMFGPNASSPNVGPSHMLTSSSQFSAPQPDRFPVPPVRTPATKDLNYYKSLIRLHGTGGEDATAEQLLPPQYQVSLPEVTTTSMQGQARSKSQKPCKFFNTPKGCRYGSSCPFDHVPLLDLRPGNYADNDRSNKRLKISSDSYEKC